MNAVPMVVECCELSMIGIQDFIETGSSCIRETFLILLAMMLFQILARILPVFWSALYSISHLGLMWSKKKLPVPSFYNIRIGSSLPRILVLNSLTMALFVGLIACIWKKKKCHLLTFNHLIKEQSGRLIGKGKYCYSICYIHHYNNHI